jgi:hypothetical protein
MDILARVTTEVNAKIDSIIQEMEKIRNF